MIGEASILQTQIDARGARSARAANARADFRSGAQGRRAQDARAQEAIARYRAPIFDLRATNRQAPRDPQILESGRVLDAGAAHETAEVSAGTVSAAAGLRPAAPLRSGEHNPLRRLSVNDAYISAETLDGPYAPRGSIFDLSI